MNTVARLIAYLAGLALVFGVAWGVGTSVGATPSAAAPAPSGAPSTGDDMDGMAGMDGMPGMGGSGGGAPTAAPLSPAGADSGGLTTTSAGYTFVPQTPTLTPGTAVDFTFTITGSDGRPVTAFDELHGRQMHLVVARRDGTGFQHLLPSRDANGTWHVPLALATPGVYRAFADFIPSGGPALVLGADLFAAGDFAFTTPPLSRVAQVDGFTVRLDGRLVPGSPSQVFATVSRAGAAVTDLQPYLGAFGHLVALRQEDFSYLHVYPSASSTAEPAPTDRAGPAVAFTASVSLPGTYRLFLEFREGDVVHTADFTVASGAS
ncbi:hypothetical protein [Pseudonocardia sp. GCM10023141]|uniref:hypothetical protein n=1 Tax=Pseudonocardia sp. GCM10023141 TaxID=3252653 RepID=UPI003608F9EA